MFSRIMNNKSKLTLIVDGNWLLMSRLSVLKSQYADDEELCKQLQLMMLKSMNVVLRNFPIIDNIIFVADGGSWRNDLPIPSFLDQVYKGTRVSDPDFNWDLFWEYYDEFISILEKNNITTCKKPGVEGDDWCWYWSSKLNKEGTNCMIWSMDKDLTQLVHTDKDSGVFTLCWNKSYCTLEDINYNPSEDGLDFFFGDLHKESNDKCLHDIIKKCKDIRKINPKEIVIDKIIRGDLGDNILPIILRHAKTESSNKLFRVSVKDLDLDLDIHNDGEVRQYVNNLLSTSLYKNKVDTPTDDIIEHFNYNAKLVTLEKESYPEEILEIMNTYTGYTLNKDLSAPTSYITVQTNNLSDILNII